MLRERDVEAGPALAAALCVERVADGRAFAALRSEWGELLDASDASAFNAWEWLYPWYRRIAPERTPWVMTARDGAGRLVGLMPLGLELRKVAGRTVRRLAFLGETHVGSDYLDVIARRGAEAQVAQQFAEAIRDARAQWDVLDLLDLDERSRTGEIFSAALAGEGLKSEVTERFLCPHQGFPPGLDFETFLKGTARRDNFLRRKKWFEKQSGYRLDIVAEPERVPRAMADFFRLHQMRWDAEGGSQGIKGWGVEAFHRDAAQLLAERGKLRLYTLRLGDAALASVYGILDWGKFLYFQSGYDPAWRNKSAGLVLVGETFRDALEHGVGEYDFLRGTEGYKADWTTQQRRTVALRVWQKGAGAWLVGAERWARNARNALKAMLPTNAVQRIRVARRQRAALRPA